jgi:hypothetical protein
LFRLLFLQSERFATGAAGEFAGRRHGLNFNDLEKATGEAEAKALQLSRGDVDAMQLSGKDRLVYGRAIEAIREYGVPLDAAALEYTEARKILDGVGLVDAARFYARHHGSDVKRKAVPNAVQEMIEVVLSSQSLEPTAGRRDD